jgi:hypothetical protein
VTNQQHWVIRKHDVQSEKREVKNNHNLLGKTHVRQSTLELWKSQADKMKDAPSFPPHLLSASSSKLQKMIKNSPRVDKKQAFKHVNGIAESEELDEEFGRSLNCEQNFIPVCRRQQVIKHADRLLKGHDVDKNPDVGLKDLSQCDAENKHKGTSSKTENSNTSIKEADWKRHMATSDVQVLLLNCRYRW